MEIQPFEIKDQLIRTNKDGLVCLTDLWKASGRNRYAAPSFWKEKDGRGFINHIAKKLNATHSSVLQSRSGKGGGTYAHPQIALAYAKYLSHELHEKVNETFMRVQSGDATIIDEVADRAKPEDAEKAFHRLQGKVYRRMVTKELAKAGTTAKVYGMCTNAIYTPILGGTAKEVKEDRNLPASASLRDNMDAVELAAVGLSELVSAKKIKEGKIQGDAACIATCYNVATSIKQAIQ